MPFSSNPDHLGGKLGPKLVKLVSDAVVATKLRLLDTEHRARVLSTQTIIDRAGKEVADHHRDIIKEALADRELPDTVREYFERGLSGRHQWQALASFGLYGSGAGSSLSTIISNFLAPGVRFAVAHDPQLTPSNEEMITASVKGAMPYAKTSDLSAGNGWSQDLVDEIAESIRQYPPLAETLELLRRGLVSRAEAELFLTRNGIPVSLHGALLGLERLPLSPADLADMVVRGIKTQAEAATVASESGVNATDFDALVQDTGEPLALQQLLEAFRRGFIDQARLQHGIRQGRTKNEWIDVAERLRFSPMSVADAVNAVVQNHMSAATGNQISELNGLEPGSFDILIQTAGEPLSRTEMEELYNRGLVTEAQVNQALLESRVKNKYVDLAFQLHRKIIPVNYVQRALRYGAITHAEAVRAVMDNGFTEADAEILVTSGSAEKMFTYKNRVVSAIESAYEENTLTRDEAISAIRSMGFDDTEAQFIVKASEYRRNARIQNQAIGLIHGRYVQHRLTRQQTSNDLDSVGIPAPQRDYMLRLWDIEHAAHTRDLTEAQVAAAVKKQLITPQQGFDRLLDMGYSQDDATLLIEGA